MKSFLRPSLLAVLAFAVIPFPTPRAETFFAINVSGEGLGVGLKGSLLRTWFEPIGADKNTTYMGMELQGGISSIVLSLGGYRRIDGDGDGWLGTISLGIRL